MRILPCPHQAALLRIRTIAAATPTTTSAIPSKLMADSTTVSPPPSRVVVEVVGRIVVELFVDDERDDVVLEVVVLFVFMTWGRFMVELPGRWVAVKGNGDRQQRTISRVVIPLKSRLIGTGVRYN